MSDRRKILSWAMYDWANSAFSTTVMAGFFPVFFKEYWSAGTDATVTTARLGTTLSISGLLIAILSPTLGAMADRRGSKKKFCAFFMTIGALSCVGLAFIPAGDWANAMLCYGLAMFAFTASCVFYDALLPNLAHGTKMDDASSLGYSLGYLGGGVLFLFNVATTQRPELFGFADAAQAVKASFISVGLWWSIFSIPMFLNVPEPAAREKPSLTELTTQAVAHLAKTVRDVLKNRNLATFLIAYWLYIDGVSTVMMMAVDFGLSIGLASQHLIIALLLVQFIGFPATWVFGKVTGRFGCRIPILACIAVYSAAVLLALGMSTVVHFYALAAVIGLVQGGVQSLSRSLFAHMVPKERAGEFFGLFNLVGKFAAIGGPAIVALTVTLTGNSRAGMTGLLVLFVIGGILLWRVREPRFS